MKHSPETAPVKITVRRERYEHGERARVDIADKGPGVPPEILPRLFERFVTGEARRGGTGLGLYLAHRIAVMHGGDLTVASTLGEGTRMSLLLPCGGGPAKDARQR
jgi:two-component system, OmpR family, sensor kinase